VSTYDSWMNRNAVAPGDSGCYPFWRCAAMSGAIIGTASPSPPSDVPTGAQMKLSISYKHVDAHKPVDAEVEHHLDKLGKLLKNYEPDLVQLHCGFSINPRTGEPSCTLNLSLPAGTLHATGAGASVRTSCKKAFSELEAQVKKYQSKLRKDYQWKRKRPLPRAEALS
jgi:ribosome-associated translation inhibitor RaiA